MTRPRAMTDASGAYGAGGGAGGHHLAGGGGGGDAGGDGGGSEGRRGQVQHPASTGVVRRLSHCSGAAPSVRGRGRCGQPHLRRRGASGRAVVVPVSLSTESLPRAMCSVMLA